MIRKSILIIIVVLQIGCVTSKKVDYELIGLRQTLSITKGKVDTVRLAIENFHPDAYLGIDSLLVDSVASEIVNDNENKLLSNADFTLEMRRLTDLFHHVDPHLIYYPRLQIAEGFSGKLKNLKVLPFEIYNINDTLLIKTSYSKDLLKGDQLLTINGHEIDEFKKYIYPSWRSLKGYIMQLQSQLTFSENYQIVVNRKGIIKEFTVGGVRYN